MPRTQYRLLLSFLRRPSPPPFSALETHHLDPHFRRGLPAPDPPLNPFPSPSYGVVLTSQYSHHLTTTSALGFPSPLHRPHQRTGRWFPVHRIVNDRPARPDRQKRPAFSEAQCHGCLCLSPFLLTYAYRNNVVTATATAVRLITVSTRLGSSRLG